LQHSIMASMAVMEATEDIVDSEATEDIADSEATVTGMASAAAGRLMIRTPKNSTTDTSEDIGATVVTEDTEDTAVMAATAISVKNHCKINMEKRNIIQDNLDLTKIISFGLNT
jgi:hypothetical protein